MYTRRVPLAGEQHERGIVPASGIRAVPAGKDDRIGVHLFQVGQRQRELTLGAAAFFERMFAEHQAERTHGRQLQATQLAESGAEYIKALLQQDPAVLQQNGGLYGNPNLFQGILVNDDPSAAFRGKFTILAPEATA